MRPVLNYHFLDIGGSYQHYSSTRSAFQDIFADFLRAESAIAGRVLDIGCGHVVNPTLKKILAHIGRLDGVDPFPVVEPPQHLSQRWTCPLEQIPVEPGSYDMAYSYNVVEHVNNIEPFLAKATEILKGGGVYWSVSPNAKHPFTWVTRLAQVMRVKNVYQRNVNQRANDYPAYYRLSHDGRIVSVVDRLALPVAKLDFYYLPCVQWDTYFPPRLRTIPRVMDKAWLLHRPKKSFIFMFRLEKQA